jgi:signal transduction histidine kinase
VRDGKLALAHRLEELWNELGRLHPLSLLCSYALDSFADDVESARFAAICAQHSHVMPTECYLRLDDERTRLREVSRLQQRDRALTNARAGAWQPANMQQLDDHHEHHDHVAPDAALAELLLRALSRELREPLQAMLDATRALARTTAGTHVQRLMRRGSRMLRVLEEVTDVTRVQLGAGIPVLREGRHDAGAIVEQIVIAQRAQRPEHAIELSCSLTRPVCIDRERFSKLTTILIEHAAAHALPERAISVSIDDVPDGFALRVRFSGEALAPQNPFTRPLRELATLAWEELGLSLHIAERVVHAHGGRLSVHPSPARGTTFEALFPE